jgi:ribosomal protein S18 acetylase RimI-like enzyme
LPGWIPHPGVLTFIDEDDAGTRRGFILLGFYEPEDGDSDAYVADLLAIAVVPEHQGHGVGKRLLEYAIDLATLAGERVQVAEIRLTVADTNQRAQRLFKRCGFDVLDSRHGAYDGGQTAIRMRRKLR